MYRENKRFQNILQPSLWPIRSIDLGILVVSNAYLFSLDVHATLLNTTNGQTLTAKHPAANFLAIVTHIVSQRILIFYYCKD